MPHYLVKMYEVREVSYQVGAADEVDAIRSVLTGDVPERLGADIEFVATSSECGLKEKDNPKLFQLLRSQGLHPDDGCILGVADVRNLESSEELHAQV